MRKFKTWLYETVWVSRKWTYAGWLIGLAISCLNEVLLPYLGSSTEPWARMLYPLGPVLGTFLRDKAAIAAHRAEQEEEARSKLQPVTLPPACLLALVLGALLFAGPAFAQSSPVYGGCFNESKSICAGPGATLSLVGLDLKKGEIVTGLITGVGYEITFFSQQWYRLGVGVYGNLSATSSGTSGLFSGIVSFANFLRLGIGEQVIGAGPTNGFAASPTVLLGIGSDFGRQ